MSSPTDSTKQLAVLVAHDGKRGPTATQMISFGQPFDPGVGYLPIRIAFDQRSSSVIEVEKSLASHRPDVLVLSRYTSELGLHWIRLARAAGIPVIFHIDDDLLAVPASLGEAKYRAYNSPERLKALRENIDGSDLLYVSTAELAKRFAQYSIGTPIVAGEIYCSVDPDRIGGSLPSASGPVIGYMGTSGHSADLAMAMPAVCKVMDEIPDLQFELFGTIRTPGELGRFGRRVRHIPPLSDYDAFIGQLRSLGWWVGLAPLEDNSFNRCKADTKWVEYSMAGIAVVASDLPVYHRACAEGAGLLADSTDSWTDALCTLILQPALRTRMVDTAQAKLRDHYAHELLRAQLVSICQQALGAG